MAIASLLALIPPIASGVERRKILDKLLSPSRDIVYRSSVLSLSGCVEVDAAFCAVLAELTAHYEKTNLIDEPLWLLLSCVVEQAADVWNCWQNQTKNGLVGIETLEALGPVVVERQDMYSRIRSELAGAVSNEAREHVLSAIIHGPIEMPPSIA